MVAYNFKKQFAGSVARGEKLQTIRRLGLRRHAQVGDRIQLYYGQRTKACRKLLEYDPVCTASESIVITKGGTAINGRSIEPSEELALAKADGFSTVEDYRIFFLNDGVFEGKLIVWASTPHE